MKKMLPFCLALGAVLALAVPVAVAGVLDDESHESVGEKAVADAYKVEIDGMTAGCDELVEQTNATPKDKALKARADAACKNTYRGQHEVNETQEDADAGVDTTTTGSIPPTSGGSLAAGQTADGAAGSGFSTANAAQPQGGLQAPTSPMTQGVTQVAAQPAPTVTLPGSQLLSKESLGTTTPGNTNYKTLSTNTVAMTTGQNVNLNSTLMSTADKGGLYNNNALGLQNNVTSGNTVKVQNLTQQQVADINTRYNPAQTVIAGQGSGMVRCSGKSAACPGGKWAVDTTGSRIASLDEARTGRFVEGEWFQTKDNGLTDGFLVDKTKVPDGTTSAMVQTASLVTSIGRGKGMSELEIATALGTIHRESKFNTAIGPNNPKLYEVDAMTSAWGYGQYVGDTWLGESEGNRNDSLEQINVTLNDTSQRYAQYNKSPLKNVLSFGQYDYAIHHDGSIIAGGLGNAKAIGIYNRTASSGLAVANYVMGGNINGTAVAGGAIGNIIGSGSLTGAGQAIADAAGYGSVYRAALNGDVGGIVKSLGGGNASQLLAQAMNGGQAGFSSGDPEGSLAGGSGSSGSGGSKGISSGSGNSKDTDSSASAAEPQVVRTDRTVGLEETVVTTTYSDGSRVTVVTKNASTEMAQAFAALESRCGANLEGGADAFMLKLEQCMAVM